MTYFVKYLSIAFLDLVELSKTWKAWHFIVMVIVNTDQDVLKFLKIFYFFKEKYYGIYSCPPQYIFLKN